MKVSQGLRSAKIDASGLVNFVPAIAYHYCLDLPAAFTQPGTSTLADLCTRQSTNPSIASNNAEISLA